MMLWTDAPEGPQQEVAQWGGGAMADHDALVGFIGKESI
jgi:hypothetical protein